MPNLKLIATRSTGYDHVDMEECKKWRIMLCNIPDYGDNTVAEFTMLLTLALLRKLKKVLDTFKDDIGIDVKAIRGYDLKEKTIGIVGAGRIGKPVGLRPPLGSNL